MKTPDKIERMKNSITEKLNNSLNRIPVTMQRRGMLFVGFIMAAACLFMVLSPFTSNRNFPRIFPEGRISTAIVPFSQDPLISTSDLMMLRDFKHVMDSLKTHDITIYHEILQGRPGLMDSVEMLIEWYQ